MNRSLYPSWITRLSRFSGRCVLCERACNAKDALPHICGTCLNDMPNRLSACRRCGLLTSTEQTVCGRCLQSPPLWGRMDYIWRYESYAQWLLQQYKFSHQQYLMADFLVLAKQWANTCTTWSESIDVIIPMPMHPRRALMLGANHADVIAQAIGQTWCVPVMPELVSRKHHMPRLASAASKKQRLKLMKNAFQVHADSPKRVLIVDDVMTTGASAEALTKCLKQSGGQEVSVFALARTL